MVFHYNEVKGHKKVFFWHPSLKKMAEEDGEGLAEVCPLKEEGVSEVIKLWLFAL